MPNIPRLKTARLELEPVQIEDSRQVQVIFPQWEIVQYLANVVPWPYPEDGALSYYRDQALPAVERGDEWHWSLRLKSAPEQLIGCICLIKGEQNNRGFWLGLPWQGKGLMTEAVEIVTDFWFDELSFPVLKVPKAIANTASRRISQKSGMRVVVTEERDFVSGRLPSEIWEITAEEWRARHASTSK
jgi:RimJ/RimL family protein N-acetyltransferase